MKRAEWFLHNGYSAKRTSEITGIPKDLCEVMKNGAGQKIVLGKGWKMKDGKPVRSGKGKSVSQKIAERKNPKRKWGKAK